MSYFNTLILLAPDCPRKIAVAPTITGGKRTVAVLQFELLTQFPGQLTEKELYFRVHCMRNGIMDELTKEDRQKVWDELFSKPQACMRTSPLGKTYGWGIHYGEEGRIRLVAAESKEYRQLSQSSIKMVFAMRSRRTQEATSTQKGTQR